jgi:hypothetical protein
MSRVLKVEVRPNGISVTWPPFPWKGQSWHDSAAGRKTRNEVKDSTRSSIALLSCELLDCRIGRMAVSKPREPTDCE